MQPLPSQYLHQFTGDWVSGSWKAVQRQMHQHILSSVRDQLLLLGLGGMKGVNLTEDCPCSVAEHKVCQKVVLGLLPHIYN